LIESLPLTIAIRSSSDGCWVCAQTPEVLAKITTIMVRIERISEWLLCDRTTKFSECEELTLRKSETDDRVLRVHRLVRRSLQVYHNAPHLFLSSGVSGA